jgi:hypothetical protein
MPPLRNAHIGFDVKELAADIVIDIMKLARLYIEGVATLHVACRQQRALCSTRRDIDIRRNAVRPITPANAVPGLYSCNATSRFLLLHK